MMDTGHAYQARYDAVIVGARCAGAATAFLLARAGAKVLLIDRQSYGSDTMSTHALMRTGVLQLHRWGLLPQVMAAGTPEIRSTTFHYGSKPLRINLKSEHGIDYLCAPRRTVLDRILVDAARAAGAEVRHGVVLSDVEFDASDRVSGAWLNDLTGSDNLVRCDMLIGADGRESKVARLVNAETCLTSETWSGCVYGYYENLEREGYHWHFASDVAASIIPTNHDQHCVAASVPGPAFSATFRGNVEEGFMRIIEANSPELADDMRRARPVARLRGFPGIPGHLRRAFGPGWALVGDAGYFKDPLTAHGITDALRDAELLVRALLEDGLPAYQRRRDALSRSLFEVTDAITSFRWDLDEVASLHTQLSAAMRAETDAVARLPEVNTLTAKEDA
jgi:2-polyprenyl-6-methoxyphenol hydroxylase-like FAD-dependent oxidoreductase